MVLGAAVAVAAAFVNPPATQAQAGHGLDLAWNTLDAGGVTRSIGDGFELSGTIGQIDAGRASGGGLELTGGFWFELVPADCNEDGAVTLFDLADFIECLFGPTIPDGMGPLCACLDLNRDLTVSLSDFAELQNRLLNP
jgi:hypothetical protein